jgi:hypothetical protein
MSHITYRPRLLAGANRIRTAGPGPAKDSAAGRPSRTPARTRNQLRSGPRPRWLPPRGPLKAGSFSVGPRVRIRLPPAASQQTPGPSRDEWSPCGLQGAAPARRPAAAIASDPGLEGHPRTAGAAEATIHTRYCEHRVSPRPARPGGYLNRAPGPLRCGPPPQPCRLNA